ncbi:MAG: acetyl-CoA carboxylase biotin carboxyl carrier protein [bacterium]|nr:acetyl-CoA carboxylase biotin carboxyl carrier protein [bacterium]
MDIQKIEQILNLIEKTNFVEVEIEEAGFRIKARRANGLAAPRSEIKPESGAKVAAKDIVSETDNCFITRSPLVGTFYRAPSPNATPFVEVGDVVKKGQVLCIIEAMKLMNEVEAEVDGKIVSIFVENAQPVEYGEPLFLIQKS